MKGLVTRGFAVTGGTGGFNREHGGQVKKSSRETAGSGKVLRSGVQGRMGASKPGNRLGDTSKAGEGRTIVRSARGK